MSWGIFANQISTDNAQKMKISIKDFFSKCDQIHRKLRMWSHLLKKFLVEIHYFDRTINIYLSMDCQFNCFATH